MPIEYIITLGVYQLSSKSQITIIYNKHKQILLICEGETNTQNITYFPSENFRMKKTRVNKHTLGRD